MPERSKDRIYGTLEALVLKTLAAGPLHGYGIARWIEFATEDVLASKTAAAMSVTRSITGWDSARPTGRACAMRALKRCWY